MAIDTREKRASVLGVGRPWMRTKEPVAAKTQPWRMSSGNTYGGNSLTSGSSDSQVLASVRVFVAKNVNSKILSSKQVDSKILVGLTRGDIL